MLRRFRMVGEDSIITVQRKCDHTAVFIAQLMHACYHVLPLARNDKIYSTATDFGHQGLVHSSTRFCCTATDIYADDSMLPKRPSEFLCPAYPKYNSKHFVPAPVSNQQSKNHFDLINSDLLRPLSVESLVRREYMQTFVEDNTCYFKVNFLHTNSDAARLIKVFSEKV